MPTAVATQWLAPLPASASGELRCLFAPSHHPDPEARRGEEGLASAPANPEPLLPWTEWGATNPPQPTNHAAGSRRLGTEPGSFIYTVRGTSKFLRD